MEEVKTSTEPLCQMVGRQPAERNHGNPQQDREQPRELYLSRYRRSAVPILNAALGRKFERDRIATRQEQKEKLQAEIKACVSLKRIRPEQE